MATNSLVKVSLVYNCSKNVKFRSWKNQKNGENPNIQGTVGEMHQFPVILKPIWLSRCIGKLRNGPRTQLSIDT